MAGNDGSDENGRNGHDANGRDEMGDPRGATNGRGKSGGGKSETGKPDAIAALEKRIAELQARRQRILAVDRERERKRDRQRRIILGGGLLARARQGDTAALRIINAVRSGLERESDRRAFEGWKPPTGDAS